MVLRLAGVAFLLAAAAPAHASNWYFVDSASDHTNISFVDKDSIQDKGGILTAAMFSLLAQPEEGASAYKFIVEFDCKTASSRLATGEMFDTDRKSHGIEDIGGEWKVNDSGSQGATIQNFVCSRGAGAPASSVAGKDLPFERGRVLLDAYASGEDK